MLGLHGSTQAFCSCSWRAQLPQGKWGRSFLTGDRTHVSCVRRQDLNHWTTREVPPTPLSKSRMLRELVKLLFFVVLICKLGVIMTMHLTGL